MTTQKIPQQLQDDIIRWNLDPEEQEEYLALEMGLQDITPATKEEIERHRGYAKYTLAKSKSISIRLTPSDLERIKAKAIREGMPYQTLIGSVLHKYAYAPTV